MDRSIRVSRPGVLPPFPSEIPAGRAVRDAEAIAAALARRWFKLVQRALDQRATEPGFHPLLFAGNLAAAEPEASLAIGIKNQKPAYQFRLRDAPATVAALVGAFDTRAEFDTWLSTAVAQINGFGATWSSWH